MKSEHLQHNDALNYMGVELKWEVMVESGLIAMLCYTHVADWRNVEERKARKVIQLVERLAILFVDHGMNPPSTIAARLSASCGASTIQSLIAGLACMGEYHMPIEEAARFFVRHRDYPAYKGSVPYTGKKVPGYGHPIHKKDPRVSIIAALAEESGSWGNHCAFAWGLQADICVPLNYAGAAAAVLLDIGFPPAATVFVPLLGRIIGLSAHILEQQAQPQKCICAQQTEDGVVIK